VSIQQSKECFPLRKARILVNEECRLSAIAVEPKRGLAAERVNFGGLEPLVDGGRLAAARAPVDVEASDFAPRRNVVEEAAKTFESLEVLDEDGSMIVGNRSDGSPISEVSDGGVEVRSTTGTSVPEGRLRRPVPRPVDIGVVALRTVVARL